ncbi:uncharacterized protein LOC134787698 [Penaeus indicus]|uniref:uncharacterized protein LOC134787698 n=1 Tax=Penaeus indicus TaxID=29960 RepID=UPI00300D3183
MATKRDLEVEEINTVTLSDVVVKSGKSQQHITGVKELSGGLLVNGNIDLMQMNGVDMMELNRTVVWKDRPATFGQSLVIENLVESEASVTVQGTVNGLGLHDLDYEVSNIMSYIKAQSEKMTDLSTRFTNVQNDNDRLTCGLYEKMSYGENVGKQLVEFAGKLTHGQWGDNYIVAVRDCGLVCTCNARSAVYQVADDGSLQHNVTISDHSVFVFKSSNHKGTRLEHGCFGQIGFSTFKIKNNDTQVITDDTLGLVADVASFTSEDNGVIQTYFVTVGRMADVTDSTETTLVTALRLEENQLVKVWSTHTHSSASTVDMAKVNDRWYMLVANTATGNSTSDPYTAKSLVYGWFPSEEKFLVQGEYMGDHVTSAIFLSSSYPVQEHFFTLAQLKAADFSSFEDNVKYTTKVLVFRFDEHTSKFKPYESLASYGVVAQEEMRIGDDLYLLLLSEQTRTLDVYEYIFSEVSTVPSAQCPVPNAQFMISDESAIVVFKCMLNVFFLSFFLFRVSGFTNKFRCAIVLLTCRRWKPKTDLWNVKIKIGHGGLLLDSLLVEYMQGSKAIIRISGASPCDKSSIISIPNQNQQSKGKILSGQFKECENQDRSLGPTVRLLAGGVHVRPVELGYNIPNIAYIKYPVAQKRILSPRAFANAI